MHSCAFEYSVRNSDLYDGVGGFSRTNADFIMFYQYLNNEDYVAYVPLAAMFLVMSAYRATYLYGASSSRMRSVMPTYALQWKAMQIAKQCGCMEYDMFGVAPNPDPSHPMYGLYKLKQGFGGEIFF